MTPDCRVRYSHFGLALFVCATIVAALPLGDAKSADTAQRTAAGDRWAVVRAIQFADKARGPLALSKV